MESEFEVQVKFDEKSHAEAIYSALIPEARRIPTKRYSINLGIDGKNVTLQIKAKDLVALRAALNAYLRYLSTCHEIIMQLSAFPKR